MSEATREPSAGGGPSAEVQRDPWTAFCRAADLDPAAQGRSQLDGAIARGEAAVPEEERAFAAHLGSKVCGEGDPLAALASLHLEDLWLAFACARGDQRALARFEAEFGQDIARGLAQSGVREAEVQDAAQLLREKLFVGVFVGDLARPPKVLDYAGRGALRSWVRIGAIRTSLNAERSRRRRPDQCTPSGDEDLAQIADDLDPELVHLKRHYQSQFKQAFEQAVAELSDRDRNVLRYHLVERLNIDEIGAAYGVHRATAARWIAAAREAVVGKIRGVMTRRFGVPAEQLDSVLRLAQSELDLSVGRVLGSREPS